MSMDLDDQLERDGHYDERNEMSYLDNFEDDENARSEYFKDVSDAFRSALTAGGIRAGWPPQGKKREDRGERMLADLDQEAVALREALARNALARECVRKQQDQKLAMGDDIFEVGDVIRWSKRFFNTGTHTLGEQVYTYAAVKTGDGTWAVTGATQKRLGWAGLLAFMIARGQVESAEIMKVQRKFV